MDALPLIQFYIGPLLSGAPFHSHGPAVNVLLHGKKLWTMLPPSLDVYSIRHPLEYELRTLNETRLTGTLKQACQFVQNQGEIVFVPRHWTHQVSLTVGGLVKLDQSV